MCAPVGIVTCLELGSGTDRDHVFEAGSLSSLQRQCSLLHTLSWGCGILWSISPVWSAVNLDVCWKFDIYKFS